MIATRPLLTPAALALALSLSAPARAATAPASNGRQAPPSLLQEPGQGPQEEADTEPPLDRETVREYRGRFEQLTALTSNPEGMASVFEDPAAVERGQAMLQRLLDAAGGLEAWGALPGLRLDLLETRLVLLNRDRDQWGVHHRVPRLVHWTPESDGYVLSEYATPDATAASFRRTISVGKTAWTEQSGGFQRSPETIDEARGLVRKEFLLSAMPFSLHVIGAELAFVRTTERSERSRDGGTTTVSLEVYAVRLGEQNAVRFDRYEWQDQLLLFVEPERNVVAQVQYLLFAKDRDSYRTPFNRAYVNFYDALEFEGVRLPGRRVAWHEKPINRIMTVTADPRAEALPPAALRKPWLAGELWQPTAHADEWDPPGRDMLEESRQPR